ncbi:Hydantoinase B/oxoprolinase [compost metagenome]
MICGAWGARPHADGVEAITNASQNLSNTPVETLEAQHPVRVEAYEMEPDSCGAGRYRGGLGIRRSYRVLADDVLLQLRADRMKFQPYGLNGGGAAKAASNTLTRGDTSEALPSKVGMRIARGDQVTHIQAGGGGFGDPLLRPLPELEHDVWNHKLSAAFVRQHHAAVVDPVTGKADLAATQALRATLAA